jgi:hypothetical protein
VQHAQRSVEHQQEADDRSLDVLAQEELKYERRL